MILTCPSCATRYTVDEAKFPADGRQVRCAKCGHNWHQPGPGAEEPEIAPEPVIAAPEPETVREPIPDIGPEPALRPRGFAAMSAPDHQPTMAWLPMAGIAAGWAGLIAVVLLIGFSAVRYRQHIASIWPQSAGVYTRLGLPVSAGGIDFRNVDYKRESEDGQPVLLVTGQIVNLSGRELPIPQTVRVTLTDADNRELYHWPFKPTATTLKAGGSLPFRTRLSSPPAAARFAVVTFAKD